MPTIRNYLDQQEEISETIEGELNGYSNSSDRSEKVLRATSAKINGLWEKFHKNHLALEAQGGLEEQQYFKENIYEKTKAHYDNLNERIITRLMNIDAKKTDDDNDNPLTGKSRTSMDMSIVVNKAIEASTLRN